jgi:histidine triad (HIT) family protein
MVRKKSLTSSKPKHAPKNYQCPFCSIARLEENEYTWFKKSHLVFRDRFLTAWISSAKWPPCNGIVIIIPNRHFENIFDTPDPLLGKISILAKKIALAMKKAYKCDGVSTRQHNEPAGNQEVWHYHFQVIPRYRNDNLYANYPKKQKATDKERTTFAKKLKRFL